MRDINVTAHDGIDLAVRDHEGDGRDVLLLHGGTRTLLDWSLITPLLEEMRAVSMDLRWHGYSGDPDTFRWDDCVADVDDVIAALDLHDPVIVGHSYGGSLAGSYAAAHPESAGAINIDGFELTRPELYDGIDPERAREFIARMQEMQRSLFPDTDEGDGAWRDDQVRDLRQMELAFGLPKALAREAADRCIVLTNTGTWMRRPPRRFHEQVWADGATPNVLETIAQVKCQFLFVKCLAPSTSPPNLAELFDACSRGTLNALRELAETRPNQRVETIEASHGVIFERPEEIARLITTFPS